MNLHWSRQKRLKLHYPLLLSQISLLSRLQEVSKGTAMVTEGDRCDTFGHSAVTLVTVL